MRSPSREISEAQFLSIDKVDRPKARATIETTRSPLPSFAQIIMNDLTLTDDRLRDLMRPLLIELLRDRRDLLRDLLLEILEDLALGRAMNDLGPEDEEPVDRAEIFALLDS